MLDLKGKQLSQAGPPDLDVILDRWIGKLKDFLSGKPSGSPKREQRSQWDGSGSDSGNSSPLPQIPIGRWVVIIGGGAIFLWVITGFYIVDEKERAAVLRFGKFNSLEGPGIHWAAPMVDQPLKVNVKQVRSTGYSSTLLTGDENIVKITYEVQYIVSDPIKFLFNVRNPEEVLGQVVNSTFREVVGQNKLDYVLLEGRPAVAQEAKDRATTILDEYQIGLSLQTINFQEAQPPEEVPSLV